MTEVPDDFPLPTKKVKRWKISKSTKVSKDWKPMVPTFCTVIHPDTGKRCGNFMRNWDEMFYEQYGMCEECYLKYNSHVDEIKQKMNNELGEVENRDDDSKP